MIVLKIVLIVQIRSMINFCSVGHNVVSNMTNNISDNDTMSSNERLHVNDHVDAFRFTEIKESYVFKQLKSISVSKATGIDEIPVKLLKIANVYISSSLAHICNVSLKKGKVPDEWKEAKVTLFIRVETKVTLITLDQFRSFPLFQKSWKDQFIVSCMLNFRTVTFFLVSNQASD